MTGSVRRLQLAAEAGGQMRPAVSPGRVPAPRPRPRHCACACNPRREGCASRSSRPVADARMLWLCIRLPRLAAEALAAALRRAAPAATERAALERLAAWALQWSSQVSLQAAGRDDGGAARPVAGDRRQPNAASATCPHCCARTCARALQPLGYTARAGGRADAGRARQLLARAGIAAPAHPHARGMLREQLAPLPLALLALPAAVLAACDSAGLRRIGELLGSCRPLRSRAASAPRPACICSSLPAAHPSRCRRGAPPDRCRSRCEFTARSPRPPRCCFRCSGCCTNSQGYLRARRPRRAALQLTLEQRPAGRAPAHRPVHPGRDAGAILRLARERLAGAAPGAPVCALVLEADAFTRARRSLQGGFLLPATSATSRAAAPAARPPDRASRCAAPCAA